MDKVNLTYDIEGSWSPIRERNVIVRYILNPVYFEGKIETKSRTCPGIEVPLVPVCSAVYAHWSNECIDEVSGQEIERSTSHALQGGLGHLIRN